jgi:hypothetical protein
MKKLIILSLACSLNLAAQTTSPVRSLVLFGGGGEPVKNSSTIFDRDLNSLATFLDTNKWNSDISFNGGHSDTEAIIASKFPSTTTKNAFTENNYKLLIKKYEDQIKSGTLKSGDQLMLMIDTHGAMQSPSETTHQIAIGRATTSLDLNSLSNVRNTNLDHLKNLTMLAKEKGIKLAILDFSCHSGSSLSLANEGTCVIAASGPKHLANTLFADNFFKELKAGRSLEDVFLATRKADYTNSYPMISTAEGQVINKNIYPNITPYIYSFNHSARGDKMENYLIDASTQVGYCAHQDQFLELQKQLDSLSKINNTPEIDQIKKLVEQYKAQQDKYIDLARSWGASNLTKEEHFIGSFTVETPVPSKAGTLVIRTRTNTMKGDYTWQELLEADFDTVINNVTKARETADPEFKAQLEASIDMHTKARNKQQEILSLHPNLKDLRKKFNEQLLEVKEGDNMAYKIAAEERKLYQSMYDSLKLDPKVNIQKNPCKDFVL